MLAQALNVPLQIIFPLYPHLGDLFSEMSFLHNISLVHHTPLERQKSYSHLGKVAQWGLPEPNFQEVDEL